MIIASLFLAAAAARDCRMLTDDVIRMRDLAKASPVFDRVDPDTVIGYAPLPGAVRVLQGAQLARLAKRHGVGDGEFEDVCFQRAMRQLDEQEILQALKLALSLPGAEVELADFSRFPAPVGDLVFPRSGLGSGNSKEPLLWKGYVAYGSGHHFPVWVRVRLRATLNRVIATDNLVTNKAVRADQVRIERLDGVPDALAPAQSLEDVVGKLLLRPVRRGTTISLDDLATTIAIHRGDKVDVDFQSPVLHLRFVAAAETDARFGERVRLRNLQSSQLFSAEVCGNGQARVRLDESERTR